MARHRDNVPRLCKKGKKAVVNYYDPGTGTRRQKVLGDWDSLEAGQNYRRILAELAVARADPPRFGITVAEIASRFLKHAESYYLDPYGKQTSEVIAFRNALEIVAETVKDMPAIEFGPLALQRCRDEMIRRNWSRAWVNSQVRRVRQVWRWAAEQELIAAEKWQALSAVRGLSRGRTIAPESRGVGLPDLRAVAVVLRVVSPELAAMIRFQWLTGCRCQDVCRLTANAIDRTGEVWVYRPEFHKQTHRGKPRSVWIGPRAQQILTPWLLRSGGGIVFPTAAGKTLSKWTYSQTIRRHCRRQGVREWTPLQLRHAAGTRFRRLFGVEAARVLLGHASAVTTEIYAERDSRGAADAMRRVG